MNDYDWMQKVMELADDIAEHKRGSTRFFTDPARALRTHLETIPYVTQDGDTLPIDVDAAMEKVEIGGRLDTKGIMDIVVQAIKEGKTITVEPTTEDSPTNEERITPMTEPEEHIVHMDEPASEDDWFLAIKQAVRGYEAEHKRTPKDGQLWAALKQAPPKEWDIEYHANKKHLTSPHIEKQLTHKAFKDRYNRYYPKK